MPPRLASRAAALAPPLAAALLLSAAGAEAAGPDAAAARRTLAACGRTGTSGGVRFACEGFATSVADYPDMKPAQVLEVHVGSLRSIGQLSTSDDRFGDPGQGWKAVRFTVRRPDGSVAIAGRAAARQVRPGATRLVSCGGPEASPPPCQEVLALLAATGPAEWKPPPSTPMFRGRAVPVPGGCEVLNASETQFRIKCGELAAVSYLRLMPGDEGRFVETTEEQILRNVPGAAAAGDRPCRIGGVAATCKVITAGRGASGASFLLGAALVDGTPVSVQCFQHAMVKGVHRVCQPLVTF